MTLGGELAFYLTLMVGQLLGAIGPSMTLWGASPHFPCHPWRELLRVKDRNTRMNNVRVESDSLLFKLGDATARLWNELNYEKRHLFFKGELILRKMGEVNRKFYYR